MSSFLVNIFLHLLLERCAESVLRLTFRVLDVRPLGKGEITTVEPPCDTYSRKRLPPAGDHFSKHQNVLSQIT